MGHSFLISVMFIIFLAMISAVLFAAYSKNKKAIFLSAPLAAIVIGLYFHLSTITLWSDYSMAFQMSATYSLMIIIACLVLLFALVMSYNTAMIKMKHLLGKIIVTAITVWFSLVLIGISYNEALVVYFYNHDVYAPRYIGVDTKSQLQECPNSRILYRKINTSGTITFLCPYASGMFNKIYKEDFIPISYYFTLQPQDFTKLHSLNKKWNQGLYQTVQSGVKHHLRININGTIYQVLPKAAIKHEQ